MYSIRVITIIVSMPKINKTNKIIRDSIKVLLLTFDTQTKTFLNFLIFSNYNNKKRLLIPTIVVIVFYKIKKNSTIL